MGHIRHHAIVVVGFDAVSGREAHAAAKDFCGNKVTDCHTGSNSYTSFAILPDGSKEFWPTSDDGDDTRNAFIAWLEKRNAEGDHNFADLSAYFHCSWVEVVIGDDDREAMVSRHCWAKEALNDA